MDMNLARETLKMVNKAIKGRWLTDEDMTKINQVILNRIEEMEKEANNE